jgi:hypothetical protein
MVIGVLNSCNRVDAGSKYFFTSAQGVQPQVLNTLLIENEGFHIHQTPTCKVLHTCYTKKWSFPSYFKIIFSGLNLENVHKCCFSSIYWSITVNQSPLHPIEYCTGNKIDLLWQKSLRRADRRWRRLENMSSLKQNYH